MDKCRNMKYMLNGVTLAVTHLPGYKKPVLCQITNNGCVYQKLATFLDDGAAETFNKAFIKMFGGEEETA